MQKQALSLLIRLFLYYFSHWMSELLDVPVLVKPCHGYDRIHRFTVQIFISAGVHIDVSGDLGVIAFGFYDVTKVNAGDFLHGFKYLGHNAGNIAGHIGNTVSATLAVHDDDLFDLGKRLCDLARHIRQHVDQHLCHSSAGILLVCLGLFLHGLRFRDTSGADGIGFRLALSADDFRLSLACAADCLRLSDRLQLPGFRFRLCKFLLGLCLCLRLSDLAVFLRIRLGLLFFLIGYRRLQHFGAQAFFLAFSLFLRQLYVLLLFGNLDLNLSSLDILLALLPQQLGVHLRRYDFFLE